VYDLVRACTVVGRHLLPLLLRSCATVRLAVRHPGRVQMATELAEAPEMIQADVLDEIGVDSAIAGTDAVVNLVGIAPIEPKQGSVSTQWNGTSKGGTA
jgi:uncharacterized protein YbjT (DUF2867 family)